MQHHKIRSGEHLIRADVLCQARNAVRHHAIGVHVHHAVEKPPGHIVIHRHGEHGVAPIIHPEAAEQRLPRMQRAAVRRVLFKRRAQRAVLVGGREIQPDTLRVAGGFLRHRDQPQRVLVRQIRLHRHEADLHRAARERVGGGLVACAEGHIDPADRHALVGERADEQWRQLLL